MRRFVELSRKSERHQECHGPSQEHIIACQSHKGCSRHQKTLLARLGALSGTYPALFKKGGRSYFRLPHRFKRAILAIDSTTIELIAKYMDWAKHRKHKAAAKVHVALDLISFIPIRIISDSANHHDGSYMSEFCVNMKSGDIAVMDRAYVY